MLGEKRWKAIIVVTSDPWRAFLKVVRERCCSAVHVLDRFHVMKLLSDAADSVRKDEVHRLKAAGKPALLTNTRWADPHSAVDDAASDRALVCAAVLSSGLTPPSFVPPVLTNTACSVHCEAGPGSLSEVSIHLPVIRLGTTGRSGLSCKMPSSTTRPRARGVEARGRS